jgi:pSer/pThr/pTyr-binding forkhead associated (FHA) protein
MNVSLVMFTADGDRREFTVSKRRTVIGRRNDCDLRIPLSSVSRQHCELAFEDGQLTLRDLGSSNGTYHNNTRVQQKALSAGDELTVGPVIFTVVIDGYPAEVKPVRSVVGEQAAGDGVDAQPAEGGTPVVEQSGDNAGHPTGAHNLAESEADDSEADSYSDSDDLAALASAIGDDEEADEPISLDEVTSEDEQNPQQNQSRGG